MNTGLFAIIDPRIGIGLIAKVEDEAVQHALQRKQERAEALLPERLEAEAIAYPLAQELKAEEAQTVVMSTIGGLLSETRPREGIEY